MKIIVMIMSTIVMAVIGHSQIVVNCDDFDQEIYGEYIITINNENNFYSYGVVNLKGEEILKNRYRSSYSEKVTISEDVFYAVGPIKDGGVLIDLKTKESLINEKVKAFSGFKNGTALIRTKNDFYYINREGKKIASVPRYSVYDIKMYGVFHNGLARVNLKDIVPGVLAINPKTYYTYINAKGEKLNDEKFVACGDFHEGVARVCKYVEGNYKWGYIDSLGNNIIDYNFSKRPSSFSDGMAIVESMDNHFGFINTIGEVVIQASYIYVSGFYKGVCLAMGEDKKFIILNKQNKILFTFSDIWSFNGSDYSEQKIDIIKQYIDEELLVVHHKKEGRNVVVNTESKVVLSGFHKVGRFYNGLCYSIIRKKNISAFDYPKGIINKKGEFILKCKRLVSY